MASPPVPSTPPADAPGDPAAGEMADVITAIFRMFDDHIDAVLGPWGPAAFGDAAHPPVTLVGAGPPDGSVPHG